jgi:hypothetical protein
MSATSGRTDRMGRVPGFVFAACAAVLVALVASAFTPAQPPPPPTAEYAPSAVSPIKNPPPQQVSQSGDNTGKGGQGEHIGSGGSPTPSPSASGVTTPPPQLPPGVLPCYGNPPRQTPDPESPPCVQRAIDSTANGGETAVGVDAETITISLITDQAVQGNALVNYFNRHFNLYGRKVVVSQKTEGCFGGSPQSMKNTAKTNAEADIFAAIGFCDTKAREHYYYDALADLGVVSVANRPGIATEKDLAKHHPYEWTWFPTFDEGQRHDGELACALRGRPAKHAGPALSGLTRKFGVIYNTYTDSPDPDISTLRSTLSGCGISADFAGVTIASDGGTAGQGYTQESIQQVNAAISRMSREGVTTLILLTHADTSKQVAQYASGQGYQPELMLSSYTYSDFDLYASTLPSDQQPHLFGPSVWNRFIHPTEEYWYGAIKEGDPTYNYNASTDYYNTWYLYKPLLMFFSGLQMAGPHLTAQTFAAGLQGTSEVWKWKEVAELGIEPGVWPNAKVPGHAEGKVSLQPGQHSMVTDASVVWFSPGTANPEYNTASSFCYLGFGRRYGFGDYTPSIDDLIGQQPCGRYG